MKRALAMGLNQEGLPFPLLKNCYSSMAQRQTPKPGLDTPTFLDVRKEGEPH